MRRDIRELIKQRGYSLRSFSAHIDIPYMTLYNALNRSDDQKNMTLRVFRSIAHGLDMTIDELDAWMGD